MTTTSGDARRRLQEIAQAFLKLGAMSYGGPAIMGIMQTEIQEKRGWLSKERFLEGLSLVGMLPGAGATQLAIFVGYCRGGWWGGVLAGLCFVLPAFFIMLALASLYTAYGALPLLRNAFYGLGPAVLGIFVVALYRLGKVALVGATQIAIALAAAALTAFTPLGIAGTLLLAGCSGITLYHSRALGLRATLVAVLYLAAVYWAETAFMPQTAGVARGVAAAPGLWDIGSFFFEVGAFSFGGGISMLAFVQDQVVNHLHWLTPREFLDGLALGQLTPGPILMLAAYVGYKLSGIAGATVAAAAIFLPSFIMILSTLPVLDRFRQYAWIKAALKAIGAAVIGTIAVSLMQVAPHALPDAFAGLVMLLAIAGMLVWGLGPLPLMLGGGVIGIVRRANPLERLKELV